MNKQLPERADLEHLKGQAKSLLKSLQSAEADAIARTKEPPRASYRLADAQLVIAREYGFPSWTKLKRHVEGFESRRSAFFHAVRAGQRDEVSKLLAEDPSLVAATNPEEFDAPAINMAAGRNDKPMIDLLLENGADIDARSTWWAGGFGALDFANEDTSKHLLQKGAKLTAHAAARLGMVKELKEIIRRNPEVVHERGGDGQFPLHFAKTPEIVDILMDAGADVDARDIDHEGTAAQWKIESRDVLQRLIERGASPDPFIAVMLDDESLFAELAAKDPEALTRSSLTPGNPMTPQAPGMHIYTYNIGLGRPFQIAHRYGKEKIQRWLQEHGSPELKLMMACWKGDLDAARALKSYVPKLGKWDQAILAEAAWDRRLNPVKVMLEVGFDPNVQGVHDSSPLDRAAFHGFADIIEAILPYKPRLDIRNEFGGTPLRACIYGSMHSWRKDGDFPKSVELLIGAGSELPEKAEGSPAVREVLVRRGVAP